MGLADGHVRRQQEVLAISIFGDKLQRYRRCPLRLASDADPRGHDNTV